MSTRALVAVLLVFAAALLPGVSRADPLEPFPRGEPFSNWPGAVQLQVSVQPYAGWVRSRGPYSIDCSRACTRPFDRGAVVTLDAVPDPGFAHVGWLVATHGGEPILRACRGAGPCTLTLDQALDVVAVFEPETLYELLKREARVPMLAPPEKSDGVFAPQGSVLLQVAVKTWAVGYVRARGSYFLDCPLACIRPFAKGTVVTLQAFAPQGVTFAGWLVANHGEKPSYEECPGIGFCTILLDRAKDVTAVFDGQPTPAAPILIPL